MVFNATFNNITVISWLSILTGVPGETHRPITQVADKIYYIMLSRVHSPKRDSNSQRFTFWMIFQYNHTQNTHTNSYITALILSVGFFSHV